MQRAALSLTMPAMSDGQGLKLVHFEVASFNSMSQKGLSEQRHSKLREIFVQCSYTYVDIMGVKLANSHGTDLSWEHEYADSVSKVLCV